MPGENIEVGSVTNFLKLGLAGVVAGIFLVLWHKYFPLAIASPIAAVASPPISPSGAVVPASGEGIRLLGPPIRNPNIVDPVVIDSLPSMNG